MAAGRANLATFESGLLWGREALCWRMLRIHWAAPADGFVDVVFDTTLTTHSLYVLLGGHPQHQHAL